MKVDKFRLQNIMGVKFDNSYSNLPNRFFVHTKPDPVKNPKLIQLNKSLIKDLGLNDSLLNTQQALDFLSGNLILNDSDPISLAYSGHQFGHFSWDLGDGRAHLLGEFIDQHKQRYDIQLKGSGKTDYSRGGDGRAPLGAVIREFILSEAMYALGVPTTRALAIVKSGECIMRNQLTPGGVLTRIAKSHIRIGTFEYFFYRKDYSGLKVLADYTINRHYSKSIRSTNRYLKFFEEVIEAQAQVVAKWMSLGFIHGVMNTDNMTISGHTIDYGPCAFMDYYHSDQVYSSIDKNGRYSYRNQPHICQWNLLKFGETLLPLIDKDPKLARAMMENTLDSFSDTFNEYWLTLMRSKLGLSLKLDEDLGLIQGLFSQMEKSSADFTLTFRYLSDVLEGGDDSLIYKLFNFDVELKKWLELWKNRLQKEDNSQHCIIRNMNLCNPIYIPRNHIVADVINHAIIDDDYSYIDELINILAAPFNFKEKAKSFSLPPQKDEIITQTFCGT